MRIMIHSNAPWVPSGYGTQCRMLCRILETLGHTVAVSAFSGLGGAPIDWNGIDIFPSGTLAFGIDTLPGHAQHWEAELVITLCDAWKLPPMAPAWRATGIPIACWLPIDSTPMSRGDQAAVKALQATPIAMTLWGEKRLIEAGFAARYAPHAIDTSQDFYAASAAERVEIRQALGLTGAYPVIGINAANNDTVRKAWPEVFEAFRDYRDTYPDARLMVHTVSASPNGYPVRDLAQDLGIAESITWSDDYGQVCGHITIPMMRDWYAACDMLLATSYAEGFCLPVIEAQACGTPTIVTEGLASTQLSGSCVTAGGSRYWNGVHHAWWTRPSPVSITAAMVRMGGLLAADAGAVRDSARQFIEPYDWKIVRDEQWRPLLDGIL